jgi:hypothetical protein
MTLEKIRRRDGEIIPFDRKRIEHAIELACDAIAITDKSFIPDITDAVIVDLDRVTEKSSSIVSQPSRMSRISSNVNSSKLTISSSLRPTSSIEKSAKKNARRNMSA